MNDVDLLSDFDARHWAERFASKFPAILQEGEGVITDVEGLMTTWFAAAIMTGFDYARADNGYSVKLESE